MGFSQCSPEDLESESVVCRSNSEVVVLRPRWGQPVCACFLFLALALPTIAAAVPGAEDTLAL